MSGWSRTPPHSRVGNNEFPNNLLVVIRHFHARPTAVIYQSRSFKRSDLINLLEISPSKPDETGDEVANGSWNFLFWTYGQAVVLTARTYDSVLSYVLHDDQWQKLEAQTQPMQPLRDNRSSKGIARQHRDCRSHFNVVSSEWESIRSVLSCLPALLSTEIIVRMQLQFALLLIAATCFVSSTADASYSALCDSVWLLLIRIMRCTLLFSIVLRWIDIFFLPKQKNKILLWE